MQADDNAATPTTKAAMKNPRGEAKCNHFTRKEVDKLIKEYDLK